LAAAFLWACFTVIMSKGKLHPLHAVALVSTGSLLIYLPIYVAMFGIRLALLPPADLAVQVIYQGILVRWRGVRCFGACAFSVVCDTPAGRMAKRHRLAWHAPRLRRSLPRKRRAGTREDTAKWVNVYSGSTCSVPSRRRSM
jgi:hypothetical protein